MPCFYLTMQLWEKKIRIVNAIPILVMSLYIQVFAKFYLTIHPLATIVVGVLTALITESSTKALTYCHRFLSTKFPIMIKWEY